MAKAVDKLAAVTAIPEPPDVKYAVDLNMWTYGFKGKTIYTYDFSDRVTDLRVDLETTQASTVEIDLEDSDFSLLDDPLFANWAFDIQDVSLDTAKKFKPTRLTNSTSTAYLGDSADLEWVLGQKPIDFTIGNVTFRLCGISTQQTTLTLTLEDRVASFLRDQKGHKSWDRSQHTRAEFVAMLCREAGVDYWIPEINVGQPVEIDTTTGASVPSAWATGKGLAKAPHLTMGGNPLSTSQRSLCSALLTVAEKLKAPTNAAVAMIYAAMGESSLNPAVSGGVFQTTGAPSAFSGGTDYLAQAKAFLVGDTPFGNGGAIKLANAGHAPAQIANAVELNAVYLASTGVGGGPNGSGDSYAGRVHISEAIAVVAAFGGPTTTGAGSTSSSGSYAFTRGPNEDSWDCIQRLASEVAWYAFVRQNRLWFVSGNYLFSQAPQMSIERGQAGVDYIDLDLDLGARDQIAELTVSGRTGLWSALPGMVVEVLKRGPATGKWFVSSLTSQPLDVSDGVQITLQKPVPKRAEPAATSTTPGQKPTSDLSASRTSPYYVNPVQRIKPLTPERIDMGVDYAGSGPLLAIGAGKITNLFNSGWPGGAFIELLLSEGPHAGKSWYYAENITPTVAKNQIVNAGDVIGVLHDAAPNCEMGWGAGTGGEALAAQLGQQAPGGDPGAWTSAAGASANRFIVSLSDSSFSGIQGSSGVHGTMPAGYP